LLFDPLDVAAAQGLDFAAQLEVLADLVVGKELWAKSGSRAMPRAARAFFTIGQATNSVVPGATVVSISVRHSGRTFTPMVRPSFERRHFGCLVGRLGDEKLLSGGGQRVPCHEIPGSVSSA
jgi:hypothetical protein